MSLRLLRNNLLSGFDAIELRHADIEHRDPRMVFGDQFDGLPSIAGFCDDFEIGLLFQEQTQPRPDNGVVVCEKDPNLFHVYGR